MLLDLRVPEQREAWRIGDYEPDLMELASRLVPADGVILDVGANIGFFACAIGRRAAEAGARIHCFEPVSSNRARLRRNIRLNGLGATISVHPLALGDRSGTLVMRRVPAGEASNAVGENMLSDWDRGTVDRESWPTEEAELSRLDDWGRDLARCDLIKIDVEGADLLVLRGAVATLARLRPTVLAELNPYWMRQIGQGLDDARALAREIDYAVLRLGSGRWVPLEESHRDGDLDPTAYLLLPREASGRVVGAAGPS